MWQLKFKEWKDKRAWSFSYKSCIIRLLTFCSLKSSLYFFFLTQVCVFYRKKRLIFIYCNVKIHLLPLKSPIFSKIHVSKKNADTLLLRGVCRVRTAKSRFISYFSCTFSPIKIGMFHWKLILRKSDFKFSPTKIYFVFLK